MKLSDAILLGSTLSPQCICMFEARPMVHVVLLERHWPQLGSTLKTRFRLRENLLNCGRIWNGRIILFFKRAIRAPLTAVGKCSIWPMRLLT